MTLRSDAPEDALIGLNRLATEARLLSGTVHDVNNALQVISGTVEILEARTDLPPALHDALARLRTQSSRAAGALAQVLLFTRAPRTGHQPVNVRELAQESLALRDFAIRRARLTAQLDAEEPGPFVVLGNRGGLQQVLLNIIINAEQALRGTGGAIAVRLSIEAAEDSVAGTPSAAERPADRSVVIRVIDTGAGVPLSLRERVFEPFVTTYDAAESAGLGLWAARLIVTQHGGTLTLEEAPEGAVFAVRLPFAHIGKAAGPRGPGLR